MLNVNKSEQASCKHMYIMHIMIYLASIYMYYVYVCAAQMEGAAAWELQEPLSCKFQCVACAMFSNQLVLCTHGFVHFDVNLEFGA